MFKEIDSVIYDYYSPQGYATVANVSVNGSAAREGHKYFWGTAGVFGSGGAKNIWIPARMASHVLFSFPLGGIIIKKKSNTLLTKVSPKKKILIDPISILDINRYKNDNDGIFFLEAYYENSGCWIKGF